jgi:hypothetical protein
MEKLGVEMEVMRNTMPYKMPEWFFQLKVFLAAVAAKVLLYLLPAI